ncbi:MAG: hypothetical protein H7067_12570, partial [Burkholderiales bacterium]|nr:hypothetical protein [Opitutaceae bacterium]
MISNVSSSSASSETSTTIPPEPVGPGWDEAFLRVESYLRAHQIESRLVLNRLAMEIVRAARAAAEVPANAEAARRDPVAL